MQFTSGKLFTFAVGAFLLFTFPPGFVLFLVIMGGAYLARHANPFAHKPGAHHVDPTDTDLSPTQQTLGYLRAHMATPMPSNNGERDVLSDYENRTWDAIVEDLSKDTYDK